MIAPLSESFFILEPTNCSFPFSPFDFLDTDVATLIEKSEMSEMSERLGMFEKFPTLYLKETIKYKVKKILTSTKNPQFLLLLLRDLRTHSVTTEFYEELEIIIGEGMNLMKKKNAFFKN